MSVLDVLDVGGGDEVDLEEDAMSGLSSCEACSMYCRGLSSGEGLADCVGHDMAYFAGSFDG